MAKIPEFLLRSLYVKGSLRNLKDGFEFQMKNELGPVRIIGANPLLLNRKPVDIEKCYFSHENDVARFADVDPDRSVLMHKGEAILVQVKDHELKKGRYTLGINVIVKDMGNIKFSVSDQVS